MKTHYLYTFSLCLAATLNAATFGDYEYELINSDTEVEITGYTGSDTDIIIPNPIDEKFVTSIGESAFDSSGVETVVFPDTLITIGEEAFYESSLTSISLPNSVTTLGEAAFEGCAAVTSLVLSENLESIPYGAFSQLAIESVVIPEKVTSLGDYAFSNCNLLNSVSLPSQLESIGRRCFRVTDINQISIPASVITISSESFLSCDSLISIDVDAGNTTYTSIDGVLFDNAITTLYAYPSSKTGSSYSVPSSVTEIESYAFDETKLLSTVELPTGISSLQEYTFYNSSITHITLPEGLLSIDTRCFFNCSDLHTIKLPSTIDSIGFQAFYSCKSLREIEFPPSLTNLDGSAFGDTDALVPIFLGNAPTFTSSLFQFTPDSMLVYYMEGATGFDSTFASKTTVALDPNHYGTASAWLLQYGLDYDADLTSDLNGDNVSLLMAYSLDLDPTENLAGELPSLEYDSSNSNMSYYAAADGLSYTVQASTDLSDWDSIVVTYSTIDSDGMQTASVDNSEYNTLFLRLNVTEE